MTDTFLAFWLKWCATVGRNVAKKAAERAYVAALKETTPEAILARLERRYREEWALRKMEYRPHCSTWLRSEDWDERETELLVDEAPLFAEGADWEFQRAQRELAKLKGVTFLPEIHRHQCWQCDISHVWEHDDPLCFMTFDVICQKALDAHRSRVEAMRAK